MFVNIKLRRFVIAALFVSSTLGLPSFAHDGPHDPPLDAEALAATLTNQMIGALRSYQRAAPQAKARLEQQLGEIAAQREATLYALVESKPKTVLLKQIPPGLREKLPASVVGLIEQEVDATGELLGRVSDDFAAGRSRRDFFLQVPAGSGTQRINVNPADASLSPDELVKLVGSTVTIRGVLLKDHLVVADRSKVSVLAAGGRKTSSGGDSGTTSTSTTAGPVDEKTLVIMGNFSDRALACSGSDLGNRLFSSEPTVPSMKRLYAEVSRDLVTFSGNVVGPFNIPYSSTGACDYLGWGSALNAAAQAAGVNLSNYRRVSYAVPPNGSCGWSGLAYLGGSFPTRSWIASCGSTGVFVHEIGHNLRFHHAATPTAEYGDGSDPMGGARMVQFNASNRIAAGWQPPGTVVDASSSGSFTLTSLSLTSSLNPQVVRLRKADTNEYYYVSLRTGDGFDGGLASGYLEKVSIHRSPGTLGSKTYVLATLGAGAVFTDSANGISITPTSISGAGATVVVTMDTPACTPSAPSISVAPISQTGAPGTTRQYGVTVTNRNGSTCASSAIGLANSLPAGFSGGFSPASVNLAPGASATATWSVAAGSGTADGSYPLNVTATDAGAGGGSSTAGATFVVFSDATPPSVSLLSPSNGSELRRGRITLSASASDSDGIARVEFYAGGTQVGTSNSSPYKVNWNARKVAPGDYTITARAFDNAGNSADATAVVTLK